MKIKSKQSSRAPKLPSGDEYYIDWNCYDIQDDGILDEPEPVIENDPAMEIVAPLLRTYGHLNKWEIHLLEATWKVSHIPSGITYPTFLARAQVISPLAADLLDSSARSACNLKPLFFKLYSDGFLRLPSLLVCFLGRVAEDG